MIKISILRESQITHAGEFQTQELADAWLSKHEGRGTFGTKASTREVSVEIAPAVINEDGSEAVPAQWEARTEEIPGYVVVITDMTAELAREAQNKESKDLLDSTDWMVIRQLETGVLVPDEILKARAEARAKIVK